MKYSLIVPVYNGELTIERCLDSLLKQKYDNFEIIVINDGSTDNTKKILKKYNKKVIIINKDNGGVGSARNLGIDTSTGDFVTFIDADDCLEDDALMHIDSIISCNTDVVISGLKRINDKTNKVEYELSPKNVVWSELKYTSTQFKIYKRDYLCKYNIRYSKYKINEDTYFVLSALSNTNNVLIDSTTKYLNYTNDNSVTANLSTHKYDNLNVLKELYKNVNMIKYPSKYVEFFYFKTIVQNVIMQLKAQTNNELLEMYNKNTKWYVKNIRKIKFYWQKNEFFSINFVVNVFVLFTKCKCQKLLIFILKMVMG